MTTPTEPKDPRLVDAEIAKTIAETKKFELEALGLQLDQELKKAETRQKLAHAAAAEYGAESMRVQTESTLRQERLSLVSNHHYREYQFVAPVYEDAVENCLAQMAIWHRLDEAAGEYRPMHVIMDSPGGSVIDGMHLFDQILAYSKRPWDTSNRPKGLHDTKITVRGYAASMAGILLQAADERVIGPESYLMIHELSTFTGGKIGEIKDEVKFLEKISDRVVNLFVDRAEGKVSREDFIKGWLRQDWWLTSEEALGLGFVDRIG